MVGRVYSSTFLKIRASKAAIDVYDPRTIEELRRIARRSLDVLQHSIPILVDEMDNAVNEAYAASPTRQYLVGLEGKIVFAGTPGSGDSNRMNWCMPSKYT